MIKSDTASVVTCQTKPDFFICNNPVIYSYINKDYKCSVVMPTFETKLSSKIQSTGSSTVHSPSMKILLVEDSILLQEVLFETINNLDNVDVAGTAATQIKATVILDEMQFDIVILDIELAQGNGFEVIYHIQKDNYLFKQPIIMMLTNHAHSHYRYLAKNLGVQYFFDKSMDFDLAIEAIEFEADRFSNAQH